MAFESLLKVFVFCKDGGLFGVQGLEAVAVLLLKMGEVGYVDGVIVEIVRREVWVCSESQHVRYVTVKEDCADHMFQVVLVVLQGSVVV